MRSDSPTLQAGVTFASQSQHLSEGFKRMSEKSNLLIIRPLNPVMGFVTGMGGSDLGRFFTFTSRLHSYSYCKKPTPVSPASCLF